MRETSDKKLRTWGFPQDSFKLAKKTPGFSARGSLYERETYLIRKACFNVWKKMGFAFKEVAVDRALTIELQKLGFAVENQKRIDITYNGEKVGEYVPDKIINGIILFELKRVIYDKARNMIKSTQRGSAFQSA